MGASLAPHVMLAVMWAALANTVPAAFWSAALLLLPEHAQHRRRCLKALPATPDCQAYVQVSTAASRHANARCAEEHMAVLIRPAKGCAGIVRLALCMLSFASAKYADGHRILTGMDAASQTCTCCGQAAKLLSSKSFVPPREADRRVFCPGHMGPQLSTEAVQVLTPGGSEQRQPHGEVCG